MFSGEAVEKHRRNKQMPGATGKGKIATQKCQNKQTTTTPPQKKITPRNKGIYQFSDKQEKKASLAASVSTFFLYLFIFHTLSFPPHSPFLFLPLHFFFLSPSLATSVCTFPTYLKLLDRPCTRAAQRQSLTELTEASGSYCGTCHINQSGT